MPTVDAVFDWTRIFVGSTPWTFTLEIVVRTAIMYLFALCLLRLMGKRGLGELSPFEFVIIIAVGSSVGDPMFYPHVPVTHAMVVLTVIVILQRMLLGVAHRHHRIEVAVKSETQVLVQDGRVLVENMRREKYSQPELFMILRESGVEQLGEV